MRPSLPRSTPAVLLLTVALLATASGGAVAGTLITGTQIKDGTVSTKDVKDRTLKVQDLAPATVDSLAGARGPEGPPGAPGAAGAAGAAGDDGLVRAYAHIFATTVTRQSGGITVTNPAPGVSCVSVPGIDTQQTAAVVTLDFSLDSTGTNAQAYAEVQSNPGGCPDTTDLRVLTFSRAVPTGEITWGNQGYFLLVP
jgi:hypothetical protein